jgi:tRNA(Ile)-lysidine synthase
MSLVARIRDQVRADGLLPRGASVVVMLSGGRDSVCLLDVAVALCGAPAVRALHVNYGLREEAAEDERHCRSLCERFGVPLEVAIAAREPDASGNLHAWARELRYAAARELAEPRDALIAAGHTRTDQLETILYRLAASPGRRALLGMSAREGRLVRPLLGVTREQTAEYCRRRGLDWREDASNVSDRYARARVRNRLLPAFEAIHPSAAANLLRTAELLREETELLDALVDAELGGARDLELGGACGEEPAVAHDAEPSAGRGPQEGVVIARLAAMPPALARLVVVRLAERASGGLVPQAGDRVAELIALGRRGGRAELHLGGLASAVVEGGCLRMRRIEPRPQRPPTRSGRRAGGGRRDGEGEAERGREHDRDRHDGHGSCGE